VPDWGGRRAQHSRHYAGLPGKGFAKILEETWTGASPTAAFWNPTRIVADNRIAALETDTSRYVFDAPEGEHLRIDVRLLLRRAFIDLIEQKGWDAPDIVLERRSLILEAPENSEVG
jgi:hypothetical protein